MTQHAATGLVSLFDSQTRCSYTNLTQTFPPALIPSADAWQGFLKVSISAIKDGQSHAEHIGEEVLSPASHTVHTGHIGEEVLSPASHTVHTGDKVHWVSQHNHTNSIAHRHYHTTPHRTALHCTTLQRSTYRTEPNHALNQTTHCTAPCTAPRTTLHYTTSHHITPHRCCSLLTSFASHAS